MHQCDISCKMTETVFGIFDFIYLYVCLFDYRTHLHGEGVVYDLYCNNLPAQNIVDSLLPLLMIQFTKDTRVHQNKTNNKPQKENTRMQQQ